jgi:indolepyruvate ferredoxin oxidoreductase beta subunit
VTPRPVTLLIAALGGEGGGVLTNWVVAAAARHGFPAQSTSIPGVAQRTGSTTYYIEILPITAAELDGRRPLFALHPGIGDVDLLLASELLEAGRAASAGFVSPERTYVIASTQRSFVMEEKTAMGDGRIENARLVEAMGRLAKQSLLLDMGELARQSGSIVNAVMLGAIAGCGRLPIPPEHFEAAIREDGKAVEANLRGFRAGLEAVRAAPSPRLRGEGGGEGPLEKDGDTEGAPNPDQVRGGLSPRFTGRGEAASLEQAAASMPAAAREIVLEGVRRLVKYQDARYARLYLERLEKIRKVDAQAGAGGELLREVARHLAVRMSFEDVIRVAQAKIEPARFSRIAQAMRADGDPFAVVEFLKPGIEELCSLLPPRMVRPILAWSRRNGRRMHWSMEVRSTSISGYLRFWLLSKLRRWRPRSHRFQEEQRAIETWLALITQAADISVELALEVAECARLIKGYGDTHRRGNANYADIAARVIRPAVSGRLPAARAVDAVASARAAALFDPEGQGLARCLAEIERRGEIATAAE